MKYQKGLTFNIRQVLQEQYLICLKYLRKKWRVSLSNDMSEQTKIQSQRENYTPEPVAEVVKWFLKVQSKKSQQWQPKNMCHLGHKTMDFMNNNFSYVNVEPV